MRIALLRCMLMRRVLDISLRRLLCFAAALAVCLCGPTWSLANDNSNFIRLASGLHIHRDCLYGGPVDRAESISRLETTVSFLKNRSLKCYQSFGFLEAARIPQMIEHVYYRCELNGTGRALGEATNFDIGRMTTAITGGGPLNITSSSGTYLSADVLFHELLHFLPTNNRSGHNSGPAFHDQNGRIVSRTDTEDRVYLMTGLCFYENHISWWTEKNLEDNCVRSLVEKSWDVGSYLEEFVNTGVPLWVPYKRGDAEMICRKVQATDTGLRYLLSQMDLLRSRVELIMPALTARNSGTLEVSMRGLSLELQLSAALSGRLRQSEDEATQLQRSLHGLDADLRRRGTERYFYPAKLSAFAESMRLSLREIKSRGDAIESQYFEARILPVIQQTEALASLMREPRFLIFTE